MLEHLKRLKLIPSKRSINEAHYFYWNLLIGLTKVEYDKGNFQHTLFYHKSSTTILKLSIIMKTYHLPFIYMVLIYTNIVSIFQSESQVNLLLKGQNWYIDWIKWPNLVRIELMQWKKQFKWKMIFIFPLMSISLYAWSQQIVTRQGTLHKVSIYKKTSLQVKRDLVCKHNDYVVWKDFFVDVQAREVGILLVDV